MPILNQVIDAFTEAHRGNFDGLSPVALLLTDRQLYELRRAADHALWEYCPHKAVEKYDGIPVIAVPEGVFYTPRVLMGRK